MIFIVLSFIVIGALVGVLAGLFGFGGGLIVVPAVSIFIVSYKPEFANNAMQIAIATSLFAMIFTSLTTTYAHHKAKNIIWQIALKLKGGLIVGTIFGAIIASYLSSELLKYLFIMFLIYTSIKWILKLLNNSKYKTYENEGNEIEPSSRLLYIYGFITGAVAVLLGIGGSIIIVPFLRHRNYKLTKAAAIASSITPFLAFFGAVSYVFVGYGASNVPEYCLGFIYLPAAICIITGAFIGGPIGVRLSGKIPQKIQNLTYLMFILLILIVMTA